MVVSPRCLERGRNPSTPSHHPCEGRPPALQASRAQRAIDSAVASAACVEGRPGPLPPLRILFAMASYLNAEKRLSKEFGGTIGCEPATMPSFAAGAAAAGASVTDGFRGGRTAACLVWGAAGVEEGVEGFGADASGRSGATLRLVSMIFGFAGTAGGALAVVSAAPMPTLRARLLKKPSDCAFGATDATRVAGAGAAAGASEAASGSSGEVTGPRGGLTWEGMVPGARDSASSDRP